MKSFHKKIASVATIIALGSFPVIPSGGNIVVSNFIDDSTRVASSTNMTLEQYQSLAGKDGARNNPTLPGMRFTDAYVADVGTCDVPVVLDSASSTATVEHTFVPKCNPKYTSTFGFIVKPQRALAAIAFDAATQENAAAATSKTMAHTVSAGDNRLLIVLGQPNTVGGSSFSLTESSYNGTAMSSLPFISDGAHVGDFQVFYLIAPASGTNNIVFTSSVANNVRRLAATSYTGAAQDDTEILATDGVMTRAAGTANLAQNVTSTADNAWGWIGGGLPNTLTSGTLGIVRTDETGSKSTIDTGSAITPAGAFTMNVSYSGTGAVTIQYLAFAPAVAAAAAAIDQSSDFMTFW